jgi:hypothetical protein
MYKLGKAVSSAFVLQPVLLSDLQNPDDVKQRSGAVSNF